MTISYPRELTISNWKTKKSRLVTAMDLEKLLAELDRQHRKIDQSKLSAGGYRNLVTAEAVEEASHTAAQAFDRWVKPHLKLLETTEAAAKKTADRLVRAKTVPKADIQLVQAIYKACVDQQKAWSDPTQNGRRTFERQMKSVAEKQAPLRRKVDRAIKDLVLAIRTTKSSPTVPYWLVGKDPRIQCKSIGDQCVQGCCQRLERLLSEDPSFTKMAQLVNKFADDYPRKQKRLKIADPKLEASDPKTYQQSLKAEQSGVIGCLADLTRVIAEVKKAVEAA